mmetsp:Transcript_6377/g.8371  ORF Transcript_6377/g.8371 Transcript_6377/m.8371 type:complete len:244 (+) Transcript_6377:177-908(+)
MRSARSLGSSILRRSNRPRNVTPPTDVAEIFESKRLRRKFKDYLLKKLAIESFLFYESLELYEKLTKDSWRQRSGTALVEKFVTEGSEYEINLSSTVRKNLAETKNFTRDTFAEAKLEVYNLMSVNFFPKFVKYVVSGAEEDCLSFDNQKKIDQMKIYKRSTDLVRHQEGDHANRIRKVTSTRKLTIWQTYYKEEGPEGYGNEDDARSDRASSFSSFGSMVTLPLPSSQSQSLVEPSKHAYMV